MPPSPMATPVTSIASVRPQRSARNAGGPRERASKHHPPPPPCGWSGRASATAGGAAPPNILFPVDRAGRKRETTLGIAGLHFEIGAFPGMAPDQFELPAGAATPRHRQGVGGEGGDPPAGNGCRWLAEIGRLCRPPPAADGEADGARAFGGKLKAGGGRHGEPRDLR